MGPEILFVGVLVVAFGGLSALLKQTDITATWARGHEALGAGRNADAEVCFRATLEMAERRFGPDHWRTALHVDALAQALIAQRRLDDAAPLVERAMGIVDRWSPTPHTSLAAVVLGAAALEGARGHSDRAMALLDRARSAAKGDLTMHSAVERMLARLEAGAGHGAEAADALARIPFERLVPSDARSLASSGLARLREGDVERAVRCLTSAHALAERESSGEFAEPFYRGLLGEALAIAGRHEEALSHLEQAVVDYDSVVGEHHPATATLLVELAAVRVRLGDLAGARVACRRVLSRRVPVARRAEDPYRVGASTGDPMQRERDRARALLERARGAGQ